MKKNLFILSAIFLVASPVLAEGWEESLYPTDLSLINKSQESEGIQFASDQLDMVNKEREPGFLGKLGKIGGFAVSTLNTAKKGLETPIVFLGQFIGRNKSASTASDAPKLTLQESEPWVKLDLDSTPDFSLKVNAQPVPYSVFEKSEGKRLANIATSEKKGQDNRMMKIQILLQDIVSTDEK